MGDFNLILSGGEKKGGRQFRLAEGLELSQFMNEGGYSMQVSPGVVSRGVITD